MSDKEAMDEMRLQVQARADEEKQEAAENEPDKNTKEDDGEVDLSLVRSCYNANELGDSLLFNHLHSKRFVCNKVSGQWMSFVGPHWEIDYLDSSTKAAVEGVVAQYLRLLARIEEAIKRAQDNEDEKGKLKSLRLKEKEIISRINGLRTDRGRKTMLNCATSNDAPLLIHHLDMDQEPLLFACANGTYDLLHGTFTEGGNPEDYLTVSSATEYDPDATCPRWEKFIHEILGGEEDVVDYVHRLLGYSASGLKIEHLFVVLFGPHGRNGKSTLINVLSKVLGPLVNKINSEMLMAQRFGANANAPSPEKMDCKGRRYLWASETSKGQNFAHDKVKEWSGGEPIKGRGLQDKFMTEFWPTWVLYLLCNDLPKAPPNDNGFWSRIRVVLFPNSYESICTEPHHRPVDKDLEKQLIGEGSGIINWLIKGFEKWNEDGLNPPEKILRESLKYRNEVDDLKEWIDTECDVSKEEDFKEGATILYSKYRTWWEQHNTTRAMNQRDFSDQLQAKGFKKYKSGKIFYLGIRIKFIGGTES